MLLETQRLKLKPLTALELALYSDNDDSFENQESLEYVPRLLPEELQDIITSYFLPQVKANPSLWLYYTLWVIIHKESNKVVGEICFKGPPSEEGEVEIGYSTNYNCQRKGYMTEAVNGSLHWCTKQPKIKLVLAETEPNNIASERVLEKNEFVKYVESRDGSWWRRHVQ